MWRGIALNSTTTSKFNIFAALHEVMKEKAFNQLRFAKCEECGLFTPYRLKHITDNTLKCKKCGTLIQLNAENFTFSQKFKDSAKV